MLAIMIAIRCMVKSPSRVFARGPRGNSCKLPHSLVKRTAWAKTGAGGGGGPKLLRWCSFEVLRKATQGRVVERLDGVFDR